MRSRLGCGHRHSVHGSPEQELFDSSQRPNRPKSFCQHFINSWSFITRLTSTLPSRKAQSGRACTPSHAQHVAATTFHNGHSFPAQSLNRPAMPPDCAKPADTSALVAMAGDSPSVTTPQSGRCHGVGRGAALPGGATRRSRRYQPPMNRPVIMGRGSAR